MIIYFLISFFYSYEHRIDLCNELFYYYCYYDYIFFNYFFFNSYEHHIDLCNELCSAGGPDILRGKNFNTGHYAQTVQPRYFFHNCHVYRHH